MRVSEFYNLGRSQPYLDFVDIRLDTDIPVFLEPLAIRALDSDRGQEYIAHLESFFNTVLGHIRKKNHQAARRLLGSLTEKNEFHLGWSDGKSQGRGFGESAASSVWNALTESGAAVTGLLKDLEDACLLIPGIGPDMISDAVSNILRGPLIAYTQDMCRYYGIPLEVGVPSGQCWNPILNDWESSFTELPIAGNYGTFILVPKSMVRQKFLYNANKYYSSFLIPYMQAEELNAGSSLVKVLKNGSEIVTKKSIKEKYGSNKKAIAKQTASRSFALDEYRSAMRLHKTLPLGHDKIAEVSKTDPVDWDGLISSLKTLKAGIKQATEYEDLIEKIISALTYPSLCSPLKQERIHGGRKRIDITYVNEAKNGFFNWLALHYTCPKIFVECKNYVEKVANPEVDQLAGRFGPSRGKVGFLICRSIDDKKELIKRCIDTAKDQRGYIISLDDNDLIDLMTEKKESPEGEAYTLIRNRFNELIN